MSSPPRYENLSRQDEDSSLLKKNRFEDEEVDEEATVGTSYPPRHQAGSGDVNVTMTFVPRYPVRGKTEHALSVIGESREETATICQRVFPVLAKYPVDRIEFLVRVDHSPNVDPWGKVTEEAWSGMKNSPPAHLQVRVIDRPGDYARRQWRVCGFITLGVSSFLIGFGTLIAVAAHYSPA